MKKKLIILVPVLLLLSAGAAYETVLKPKPKVVVPKIAGTLVALTEPFTINLASGHYGRISVSLLLKTAPVAAAGATSVTLPENDAIRSIITDDVTGIDSNRLISRSDRHALLAKILKDLKKTTDEPVTQVLFTDVAVQ